MFDLFAGLRSGEPSEVSLLPLQYGFPRGLRGLVVSEAEFMSDLPCSGPGELVLVFLLRLEV